MKTFTKTILPVLAVLILSGCLKDKVSRTYTLFTPVYKNKQEVLREITGKPARSMENPGKIYVYGNYLFVNEINKGVHVIDNSNPSNPVKKSFLNIPGNVDIAVKGNILYADIYTDMLTLDISDPLAAHITSITKNVFPERSYGHGFWADTSQYIVDWIKKDTTVPYEEINECRGCGLLLDNFSSAAAVKATIGIAGSMSRFCIVNDYMYAVSLSTLRSFEISTPATPVKVNDIAFSFGIETIYPFADKLFIGSTTGMFIFDISNPASPAFVSGFSHARVCDPVITDGQYAYVTLRAGNTCGTTTSSQLNILDIKQVNAPVLVERYEMSNPYGLGKDGSLLWICDGTAGLKMYDVSNPKAIRLLKTISSIEPFDVIPVNGKLIVSAKEGIVQYAYSGAGLLIELSRLKKN